MDPSPQQWKSKQEAGEGGHLSKLEIYFKSNTFFFFALLEDSNIPPVIDTEIREQYPGSFMDFNLTDEKTVYVTTFQILNKRAKQRH